MMLKLRDFFHLPQLDALVQQLVADEPGLVVLAGIDSRSSAKTGGPDSIAPSGLSAIFNILMQEIMLAHPLAQVVIVAEERSLARVPKQFKRRVRLMPVEPPLTYTQQIETAARQRPGLLVIEGLNGDAAPAAFYAAQTGLRVLARFDTVLRGPAVARQFIDLGVPRQNLAALRWVLTVQRMSVLCNRCKQPMMLASDLIERLYQQFPHLRAILDRQIKTGTGPLVDVTAHYYRAGQCEHCRKTGYSGDISVFDLFRNTPASDEMAQQQSLLSLEEYVLHLAAQGQIDLQDLLNLEAEHLRRTYQMLTSSERALTEANAALNRKLMELEASNRVLVQRTEVLISLQDLGQALITSTELKDLAGRICKRAGELCGADRVVLYLCRYQEGNAYPVENEAGEKVWAEVLAVRGWDSSLAGQRLEPEEVFGPRAQTSVSHYLRIPPGMQFTAISPEGESGGNPIKMGVRVQLFSQDQQVGAMIIQSTQRDYFTPGETALLQTFANQAALAIQRAGLVDELRAKISQLEAAQAELVTKERMQRELELAREVQQSLLPQHFPEVPGFLIAAHNEPARQVGGDFYDMIRLDDDHFGIVIADVSDKGMPAALYMALTRSVLLAEAHRVYSPKEVLLNVNRLLLELGDLNGFVSVFYAVVEKSTHRMVYTRAGHERPWLVRDHEIIPLSGAGMVLGIQEGDEMNLSEEQMDLKPGDRVVLYTDGLTDVADETGSFLGRDGLERILNHRTGLRANELCQAIFDDLALYRGQADPFDDMTLLVLEVIHSPAVNV